jgi:alpha-L-rhamnosidase
MHRVIGGLAPAEPGYRKLLIAPVFTPELTNAATRHRTPHGEAAVEWQRTDGVLALRLLVPDGCTAEVRIPGVDESQVGSGEHTWRVADPCLATRTM